MSCDKNTTRPKSKHYFAGAGNNVPLLWSPSIASRGIPRPNTIATPNSAFSLSSWSNKQLEDVHKVTDV